jgi:hypothetical protein
VATGPAIRIRRRSSRRRCAWTTCACTKSKPSAFSYQLCRARSTASAAVLCAVSCYMHLSPVTVRSTYHHHGHRTQPHPPDPRHVSRDGEDVHRLRQRGHGHGGGLRSVRAAPSHGVAASVNSACGAICLRPESLS